MFHGVTTQEEHWLRVLTSTKLLEGEKVLEEFDSGPYWPAFLETFFPGKYRVEVRKISQKFNSRIPSSEPKAEVDLSPNEVIRWSNATDQYSIMINDAPVNDKGDTWLQAFDDIGLVIGNSKKMSKRLTELVRISSAWKYSPKGDIKIDVIDHEELCYLDSDVDGISAVSQNFVISCIASNSRASEEWIDKQISKILTGQVTVVQLRVLTPMGLIKGNALVLPQKMMKGFDIRTFKPNIKDEIKTIGWQFATVEFSYGIIPVKSDDLTTAIYQNVKGMYSSDDLLETLSSSLEHEVERLKNGERSASMTALVDNSTYLVRTDAQDDEQDFREPRSSLEMVQEAIRDLSSLGVPYDATQHLRFLTVNGIATQYLGVGHSKNLGQVWRNKTKHWFPVAWSYTAHIMTQEVLDIFGFNNPYRDGGYYHKKTHCFVVPGKYFAENLVNHGGPDLDDSVKVHIRMVRFEDGVKMMAIILRNPNDFSEWSMIQVNEAGPVFHNYGDTPPEVDYKQLTSKVPQATTLVKKGLVQPGTLPGVKSLKIGSRFSLADEGRARLAARAFPGGVGSSVLPKILYYALDNTYIAKPVATNEEIIDALQQGLATPGDVRLIKKWSDSMYKDILSRHGLNGTDMDIFWMETRLPKVHAEGISSTTVEESPWCQTHIRREMLVRTTYADMCDYLNSTLVEPDVIMNIEFTEEEKETARSLHLKLTTKQRSLTAHDWVEYMTGLLSRTDAHEEKGVAYTNRIMLMLAYHSYVAKRQYPRASHDQWLFTFSTKHNRQVVDWYIRALKSL